VKGQLPWALLCSPHIASPTGRRPNQIREGPQTLAACFNAPMTRNTPIERAALS